MTTRLCLAAAVLACAVPAHAQSSKAAPPPAAIGRVVACRALTDTAARLACYDREAAALEQAQASGELIAMDRQQVRKTRRSLFGLALPNLGVFGDDSIADGASELQTTIKSVSQDPLGHWILNLAEGGRWLQLDSKELVVDPAPGQAIRIRRAAMGSYLANVNKQTAIRVRRLN